MTKIISNNKVLFTSILYFIICMKIIILLIFSSEYSLNLFQPFLDNFIQSYNNPWKFYAENNLNLDSFPYHGFMLYILAIPTIFIDLFNIEIISLQILFLNCHYLLLILVFFLFY